LRTTLLIAEKNSMSTQTVSDSTATAPAISTLDPSDRWNDLQMQIDSVTAEIGSTSHAGAAFFLDRLSHLGCETKRPRILIAGCGAGHEAQWIHDQTGGSVDAIDIDDFVPASLKGQEHLRFQVASVCELPFADATFDLVFYHHVIEHVDQPTASLIELQRVLRPGGWMFVGTPNRHRLISSLGAHAQSEWESTIWNKIKDNLRDWRDRLCGRFHNHMGAHAGFSRRELDSMLRPLFARRVWMTEEYLAFKYKRHWARPIVAAATIPPLSAITPPAIYAFCQKTPAAATAKSAT
jgi:SAM-dependent methyltransferase